jgi:hypothetical protein
MKTLSWMNWALGVWLLAAAIMLTTRNEFVRAEELVAGIAIALLAYTSAVTRPTRGLSWSVAATGLWTVIVNSGAMMTTPRLNGVIVGALVAVLGAANALYRSGHGHSRVFLRIGSNAHSRGSRR